MVIGSLVYLFGHILEILTDDIKHNELLIFVVLAGAGMLIGFVHLFKKRTSVNYSDSSGSKASKIDE